MKLAEALQERADLNRRIQQLRGRLMNNAVAQEGEAPSEDPKELLEELDRDIAALEELMARINRTNCATLAGGKSLTEHIARRDCLTLRIQAYRDLSDTASSQVSRRAMRSEIKILSTVNVKELQTQIDGLSQELRLLDNLIQQTNWNTELM